MDKWSTVLPILSPRSRTQVVQRIAARKQELQEANIDLQNSLRFEQMKNFLQNQQRVRKELCDKREANYSENWAEMLKSNINRKRKQLNRELFQVYLKQCNLLIDEEKCSEQRRRLSRQQSSGRTTRGLTSQEYRDFFFELRMKPKTGKPSLLKPIERKKEPISSVRDVNRGNQYELLVARFISGVAIQTVGWNSIMFVS